MPVWHVMTFNVSISSQLEKAVGSEADFVRECKRRGRKCFQNAVHEIGNVGPLDLLALQEVEVLDMETLIRTVQPSLTACMRACTWDGPWNTVTHGMLFWNASRLGRMVWHSVFDLDVGRPCAVVLIRRGKRTTLVVNLLSFKLNHKSHVTNLLKQLRSHLPMHENVTRVVVLGDFNDGMKTFLHKPIILHPKWGALSTGLSKKEMQQRLRSCCWHEDGHPMGSVNRTSDYVLAQDVQKTRIPPNFDRDDAYTSDHLPVEAWIRV